MPGSSRSNGAAESERIERFCERCGYPMDYLAEPPRCPECGCDRWVLSKKTRRPWLSFLILGSLYGLLTGVLFATADFTVYFAPGLLLGIAAIAGLNRYLELPLHRHSVALLPTTLSSLTPILVVNLPWVEDVGEPIGLFVTGSAGALAFSSIIVLTYRRYVPRPAWAIGTVTVVCGVVSLSFAGMFGSSLIHSLRWSKALMYVVFAAPFCLWQAAAMVTLALFVRGVAPTSSAREPMIT